MRVVIFAHDFLPATGGVQTYAHLLAEGLAQGGHAVRVVTETPADQEYDLRFVYNVVRRPGLRTLWGLVGECDVAQFAGPVFLPLFLAICRRKPTVIEHHGYQAACPNGLLLYEPTKTVCPEHFLARRYHQCLRCNSPAAGWSRSLRMLLLTFPRRWLCRLANMNVPVSRNVDRRLRLPRSKVIYHGIHDPMLSRPRALGAHAPPAPPAFAYVGRLVSEKGLPFLVEAASRLKQRGRNVRLKLIGDGPERASLETLAASRGLGGQVTFPGFLYGEAMEAAMEDVTALVMPSIWEETAGLAAMEQMMRGRVVIASDIGGLGEVVDGAGLKFPPGDAEALAACLERLLDEPQLAAELARRARERAENLFRHERMVSDHLRVYAELIHNS